MLSLLSVDTKWEMVESGPDGARLVAVTMPGHAGAPAQKDFRLEEYARITAELAESVGAEVVFGFGMGATVAYEMAVRGAFGGPVVLLGVSLSSPVRSGHARVGFGS